jgi:hypothetical protein
MVEVLAIVVECAAAVNVRIFIITVLVCPHHSLSSAMSDGTMIGFGRRLYWQSPLAKAGGRTTASAICWAGPVLVPSAGQVRHAA